jgi:hypothetical protein
MQARKAVARKEENFVRDEEQGIRENGEGPKGRGTRGMTRRQFLACAGLRRPSGTRKRSALALRNREWYRYSLTPEEAGAMRRRSRRPNRTWMLRVDE